MEFPEVDSFLGEARQEGEEAQVGVEVVLRVGNGGLDEGLAKADGGELECEIVELVREGVVCQFEGEVESGGEEFEVFLVAEPIPEAGRVPIGEVAFGDGERERRVGGLVEALDDLAVGGAVVEEVIDEVAECSGEAGDFADVAMMGMRDAKW